MVEKQKEFRGILKAWDKETVTIEEEEGQERVFERENIALIRLAFDFNKACFKKRGGKKKMNTELLEALELLEKEKDISKESLLEAIKTLFLQPARIISERRIT